VLCVLIGWRAIALLRSTADVLLEATPHGLDTDAVRGLIAASPGVESVHHLHTWSLSSEMPALSAHLVLHGNPTLDDAQRIANAVRRRLDEEFRIRHATLELESDHCGDEPCR
jgi:cobalt-zinc-cadmium efflux system protein